MCISFKKCVFKRKMQTRTCGKRVKKKQRDEMEVTLPFPFPVSSVPRKHWHENLQVNRWAWEAL
jgi:hypothetical protein